MDGRDTCQLYRYFYFSENSIKKIQNFQKKDGGRGPLGPPLNPPLNLLIVAQIKKHHDQEGIVETKKKICGQPTFLWPLRIKSRKAYCFGYFLS